MAQKKSGRNSPEIGSRAEYLALGFSNHSIVLVGGLKFIELLRLLVVQARRNISVKTLTSSPYHIINPQERIIASPNPQHPNIITVSYFTTKPQPQPLPLITVAKTAQIRDSGGITEPVAWVADILQQLFLPLGRMDVEPQKQECHAVFFNMFHVKIWVC